MLMFLMGCGSKAEEAAPKPSGETQASAAAPTFGRALLSDDPRCYEFEAEGVKQKGWAWAKAMKPDAAKLEENVACPTDKLVGTCNHGEFKVRYFGGNRANGVTSWTSESASKDCAEARGKFQ